jgi:SAM-dependent methyltransferase
MLVLNQGPAQQSADQRLHAMAALEPMFSNPNYLRKRLSPQPGEPGYMHRADLLLALKTASTNENLTILDYGAGVSPYRSLFPNSDYRRADIADVCALDYVIEENGTVPEESKVFDIVLSTQVLGHVDKPNVYLSESFRLLKPAGKLLLSTHGLYEDNDCPRDFRRWTADGLRYDLENAGFKSISIYKLTTGPRAVMFFLERYVYTMSASRKTLPGLVHWTFATLYRNFQRWIHILADRHYSSHRFVPSETPHHNIYVALFACAHRPS